MLRILLIVITALAASALTGCNDDVFVRDESASSASYSVASGDSITIHYNFEGLVSATVKFDEPVVAEAFDGSGYSITSATGENLFLYPEQLARVETVVLRRGSFMTTVRVSRKGETLTVSARDNLSADPSIVMTLVLGYEYSERQLTFAFGAFDGEVRIKEIDYGLLHEDSAPEIILPATVFNNRGPEPHTFTLRPFSGMKRDISFSLSPSYRDIRIDNSNPVTVKIPSLPLGENSGGVGFWGDMAPLVIGHSELPSLIDDNVYSVEVPAMTSCRVETKVSGISISSDVTFTAVRPDGSEVSLPGTMTVDDYRFPIITAVKTPLQ